MAESARPVRRRQVLASAAAGAALLALPGKAPAQGGAKKLDGVTLNVSCWSAPTRSSWRDYIPEFEEATGIKVNFDTPAFPVYNQRIDLELSTKGEAHRRGQRHLHLLRPLDRRRLAHAARRLHQGPEAHAGRLGRRRLPARRRQPRCKDAQGRDSTPFPWIADVHDGGRRRATT